MSTFRLYFRALFGTFFLKVFLEYILMGQKILGPCLDVIMIAFFPEKYTVKEHISNTKLEKGDHYYFQTQYKDLFSPLQSYSKKTCPEKRLKIPTKCAQAPWASYNTP